MVAKFDSVFPGVLVAVSCLSLAANSGLASGGAGSTKDHTDKKSATNSQTVQSTGKSARQAKAAEGKAKAGAAKVNEAAASASPTAAAAASKHGGKPAEPAAPVTAYAGPPVLEPSQFVGEAAMGYASAKACPEVMSKVFCYCGCDISDGHGSLVDCYTGLHGTDCHICQEEAVLALRMHRNGSNIAEIQKRIDQEYGTKYPFAEESPALKKYKATRLWKVSAASAEDLSMQRTPAKDSGSDGVAEQKSASEPKSASVPKVKKGFTVGKCCGEHHNK